MKDAEYAERQTRRSHGFYDWVQALVCTVLAMVLLFTFAIRMMRVDGESMRETLQNGDMVAVLNSALCGNVRPGDVVIIEKQSFGDGGPIVKRIIATEGQTVDINFTTGSVFVDGKLLKEDYIREPTLTGEGVQFPLTVPAGCVFVMGDNRNDSDDSRDPALGTVDARAIIGKVLCVVFPGKTVDSDQRNFSRIGSI